ncbi:MAG: hypothetical protein GY915_05920 [bacterium]|nr:hypothetical protein [bacterium]
MFVRFVVVLCFYCSVLSASSIEDLGVTAFEAFKNSGIAQGNLEYTKTIEIDSDGANAVAITFLEIEDSPYILKILSKKDYSIEKGTFSSEYQEIIDFVAQQKELGSDIIDLIGVEGDFTFETGAPVDVVINMENEQHSRFGAFLQKQAPGVPISNYSISKLAAVSGSDETVKKVYSSVGEKMGRYFSLFAQLDPEGKVPFHPDPTPANIFYDELTGEISWIDISDIAYGKFSVPRLFDKENIGFFLNNLPPFNFSTNSISSLLQAGPVDEEIYRKFYLKLVASKSIFEGFIRGGLEIYSKHPEQTILDQIDQIREYWEVELSKVRNASKKTKAFVAKAEKSGRNPLSQYEPLVPVDTGSHYVLELSLKDVVEFLRTKKEKEIPEELMVLEE